MRVWLYFTTYLITLSFEPRWLFINVSCKIPNKSESRELLTITQTDNIDLEDEKAKQ